MNPSTSVLFDVFALNQLVGRLLDAAMAGGPLSPTEYALYSAIFELEAASPTAIAERLGTPLTTLLDRLRDVESREHARRVPNPLDGRSHLVVLTAAGLSAHAVAHDLFEIAHRAVIEALPSSETDAKRGLQVVRAAVDAALSVSPRRSGDRAR